MLMASTVATFLLQSCKTQTELLTQRVTYSVTNKDNEGRTDQNQFNVEYDKFIIQYSADGECTIINNSDSMMYIDMGESYFALYGEAYPLYDNTVRTNSNTTTVGTSSSVANNGYYYNNNYRKVNAVGKNEVSASQSETTSTQTQEERIVTIPPYSRRQLKFYQLGAPNIKEVVNVNGKEKEQFKKVGSVYNYTDEYADVSGHTMTYSFNPQAYKKMARNYFTLTKEEILSTQAPVQKKSVGQRTVEGPSHKVPSAGFWITFFGLAIAGGVILGLTM